MFPNTPRENISKCNTNLRFVGRKNIIYLAIPTTHTFCQLKTNTQHSSLILKSENDWKRCCLLITNIIGC